MATRYTPDRGDIILLHFNPQAGRRPALVISPKHYNRKAGLALCCPITTWLKGYPFEVELPDGLEVRGAVLSDQIKSLDWRVRKAKRLCTVPEEVIEDAAARVMALIDTSSA